MFGEQDDQIVETLELLAWPTKLDKEVLEKTAAESAVESASVPTSGKTNR